MELERLRRYEPVSAEAEKALWDYLLEQERRGTTLVTMRLTKKWYDEDKDVLHWDELVVEDWRTGEELGRFDHDGVAELNLAGRQWFDVDNYDPWDA